MHVCAYVDEGIHVYVYVKARSWLWVLSFCSPSYLLLFCVHVCMVCVLVYMPYIACQFQRTTLWNWFSVFTVTLFWGEGDWTQVAWFMRWDIFLILFVFEIGVFTDPEYCKFSLVSWPAGSWHWPVSIPASVLRLQICSPVSRCKWSELRSSYFCSVRFAT